MQNLNFIAIFHAHGFDAAGWYVKGVVKSQVELLHAVFSAGVILKCGSVT